MMGTTTEALPRRHDNSDGQRSSPSAFAPQPRKGLFVARRQPSREMHKHAEQLKRPVLLFRTRLRCHDYHREPPGTPTPGRQDCKEMLDKQQLCYLSFQGKVVESGFPTATTYTCARSPAGPRSPPRRGRWPLLSCRIPCPGPGFPAGGTSRRCSGWPVMAAERKHECVHVHVRAVAITGKCLWRRSSLGRLVRRL